MGSDGRVTGMVLLPTVYVDTHRREATHIDNDGKTLRMVIAGCSFSGTDFDSLELAEQDRERGAALFTLAHGDLCGCDLEVQIPVLLLIGAQHSTGVLRATIRLGNPRPNGGIDREEVHLVLEYGGAGYATAGKSGWFEDELTELQSLLPANVHLKTCFTCQFSDYSPYGHGSFGYLMCFQNLRAEYLRVKSKDDFWDVHDRYERLVQETYCCPEYQCRVPGTGYRG